MSQAPAAAPTAAPATAPSTPPNSKPQPGSKPQNLAPNSDPKTGSTPTPAEIRKLKLKIDGADVEMPESEVIALAQKGKVSDKRFQEASALRKQAEDLIAYAKANPKEFFAKTGMNARQWAEEYLMGELKREQMTPEQKKAAENEERLRKYEEGEKKAKAAGLAAEKAALEQKHMLNYDKMFVEALGKSGLPRTPYTIKRMAELQLVNIKNKFELSADQLAKVVREDYVNEQKSLYGALDGDQLIEIMGDDLVKKLSKAQIARLKAKATRPASGPAKKTQSEPALSWREWQKRNRGR